MAEPSEAAETRPLPSTGTPPSPSPSPSPSPKPNKKATVEELRVSLGDMGLDTHGKKETLFKRLLNAFRRAQSTIASTSLGVSPTEASTNGAGPRTSTSERSGFGHGLAQSSSLNSGITPHDATPLSPKARGKQPCRAFLCFDVEATCRGGKEFNWPNEIIEFPVVLVRWDDEGEVGRARPIPTPTSDGMAEGKDKSGSSEGSDETESQGIGTVPETPPPPRLKIVDTFHSYVRPVWQTQLSEFCTKFTGITQEMVDAAPTFPEMLEQLEAWLDKHGLRDGEGFSKAMWVTDGPWDLRDFVVKQLHITPCDPPYPLYLRQPYLNIKQAFQTILSEEHRRELYAASHPGEPPNARALSRITTSKLVGKDSQDRMKGLGFYATLPGMLSKLGLGEFEGRQHCGLDDATNVARILIALAEKDPLFEPNGKLASHPKAGKKWPWMGKPGEVLWEEWMSDAKSTPLATTAAVNDKPADSIRDADEGGYVEGSSSEVKFTEDVSLVCPQTGAESAANSAVAQVEPKSDEERSAGSAVVDVVPPTREIPEAVKGSAHEDRQGVAAEIGGKTLTRGDGGASLAGTAVLTETDQPPPRGRAV